MHAHGSDVSPDIPAPHENILVTASLPPRTSLEFDLRSDQSIPNESASTKEPRQRNQRGRSNLLKLVMIGLLTAGGAHYLQNSGTSETDDSALRAKLTEEEIASPIVGITNVLPGVQAAIREIEEDHFEPEVRELENNLSGIFSYEFIVRPEIAGRVDKTIQLTGVQPGSPERVQLLQAISEAHMVLKSGPSTVDDGRPQETLLHRMLPTVLIYGAIFAGGFYLLRKALNGSVGGLNDFLNAEAEVSFGGEVSDSFADIGGMDHVVDELRELKEKIDIARSGDERVRLPKGTLLSGPPGVGKTKLVRSLAGEVDAPFVKYDCSQLSTQLLAGSGTARVTNAFTLARTLRDKETERLRKLPGATGTEEGVCILLLDEFESIGLRRPEGGMSNGGDTEHLKLVNTLLNEMDGFNKERNKNIIVFAATNNPQVLDPALLRPGRFTKVLEIDLPRAPGQRYDILKKLEASELNSRGFIVEDNRALIYIAKITPGKSGDHLRQLLVEASEIAQRDGRHVLTQDDLFEAAQRGDSGRIKKNYLSKEKHELVAHHEHGHAIASLACGVGIFLVSMLPRGGSAGRVIPDPQGLSESMTTMREYLSRILIGAGGRAAEWERYGKAGVTDGAVSDIEHIQMLVANMISVGMMQDLYSMNLRKSSPHAWKAEHHQIINRVASRAVLFARKIIRTIGEDKMNQLVQESLALGRELVGDEAHRFYESHIDQYTLKKLQMIAEQFIADPLGTGENTASP